MKYRMNSPQIQPESEAVTDEKPHGDREFETVLDETVRQSLAAKPEHTLPPPGLFPEKATSMARSAIRMKGRRTNNG
jgi:hypothetical protein